MKTIERGHPVLQLNSAGRNLAHLLNQSEDHAVENFTKMAVVVPLLIVLLTVITLALQYYILLGHAHLPGNFPTFVDIPFA